MELERHLMYYFSAFKIISGGATFVTINVFAGESYFHKLPLGIFTQKGNATRASS